MAKSRSDRYEQELITEMEKSSALASKVARLEEANNALNHDLQAKTSSQARQIRDLEAQCLELSAQARRGREHAAGDSQQEELAGDEQLHEAQSALLRVQRDLELATAAVQHNKGECERMKERLCIAQQGTADAVAAALALPPAAQGDTGEKAEHVKCLELSLKHLRQDWEKTKADSRELPELRKKAALLANSMTAHEEAQERLQRLETKLASVLETEAQLRRELAAVHEWKLGLELGLPELAGPSDAVRGLSFFHPFTF